MDQPTLFDAPAAHAARDRAITQTENANDPRWQAAARFAIEALAKMRREMTSDDVWEFLAHHGLPMPDEPRVLGAVMKRAAAAGIIEATDRVVNSRREAAHAGPKRIWRSV